MAARDTPRALTGCAAGMLVRYARGVRWAAVHRAYTGVYVRIRAVAARCAGGGRGRGWGGGGM